MNTCAWQRRTFHIPPPLGACSGAGRISRALGGARLLGPLLKLAKPLDRSPPDRLLLRVKRSGAVVPLLGAGVLGLDMVLLREMAGAEETSAFPAIRSRKLEGTLMVVCARARLADGLETGSASPATYPSVSLYIKNRMAHQSEVTSTMVL